MLKGMNIISMIKELSSDKLTQFFIELYFNTISADKMGFLLFDLFLFVQLKKLHSYYNFLSYITIPTAAHIWTVA